jgi:hypothetical protein
MERIMPVRKEKHLSGRKSTKKEIAARLKRKVAEMGAARRKAALEKHKAKKE